MSSGSFSEVSSAALLSSSSSRQVANTVFLFVTHSPSNRMAHTFFRCDLPMKLPNQFDKVHFPDDLRVDRLQPTLEFPSDDCPRFMKCAQLGSRFYFLGGQLSQLNTLHEQIYPSDVYVFDATTKPNTTTPAELECGMTSGKPDACTFVADGKLYVLGALENFMGVAEDYKSIQLFEVYNPETGKWRNLKDPPVEEPLHWRVPLFERESESESGDCSYYPYTRKVAMICQPADTGGSLVLEFNLDTEECTLLRQIRPHLPLGLIMGDTVYQLGAFGLRYYYPKEIVGRPILRGELLFAMPGEPCLGWGHNGFCYLGDKHFCFVSTELPGRRFTGGTRLLFRMGVIRVIQEKDSSRSELRSELLYAAKFDYEIELTYFNSFPMIDCYGLYLES